MKLNSNSKLFRYAFFLSDQKRDIKSTSLCGLFWRTVFTTVVACIPCILATWYGYAWIYRTWPTFQGTLFVLGVVGLITLLSYLDDKSKERARRKAEEKWRRTYDEAFVEPEPSLIQTTFYAIKHKVCPIINIER